MKTLLTIPIATGGSFVCTAPVEEENIYLLTFTSPPDNKLGPEFLDAFLLSLDVIEHRLPRGILITTSGIQKFYSNGMDIKAASTSEGFWDKLWTLPRRLLTYPMPTIALINGHAFAGGLTIAMYHDYRVQNPSHGFLCMNELQIGARMKPPMTSIFLEKVPSPVTLRALLLQAKRFTAQQALNDGLVDAVGGLEETLRFIGEQKLLEIAKSTVYATLREELYKKTLELLDDIEGNEAWREGVERRKRPDREIGFAKVRNWENNEGKGSELGPRL